MHAKIKIKLTVRPLRYLSMAWLAFVVSGSLLMSVATALPYGSGTYGTCQYSTCGISVSSSGTVSLCVIPTIGGVYTTVNDSVDVGTAGSTGYMLTLTDSDTDTNLVSGGNTMASSSGTQGTPTLLALNTWGYRVDGLSGFGAGPTTTQNSVGSSSYTFAGVPASNQTAHVIRTTATAADPPETTTVWYGVRVDISKPSGVYSNQVTYTAVTND